MYRACEPRIGGVENAARALRMLTSDAVRVSEAAVRLDPLEQELHVGGRLGDLARSIVCVQMTL